MEPFQAFLNEWLIARGWTVNRLAEEAGISQSLISRWLHHNPRRQVRPTDASLKKIAPVIGRSHEELMRMVGRLDRTDDALAEVRAQRQVLHDQVDRWITAVGPDYEDFFWTNLKDNGDSTVRLIQKIRTAVNSDPGTDINQPSNDRSKRGRRRRGPSDGRLTGTKYASAGHSAARYQAPLERKAA